MELRKYFDLLWRRKLIIITTTIVTIFVVGVGTRFIIPIYQASATLRIAVSAGGSLNYSDFIYADRLMNTYVEIATSRPVVEELVKHLGLTKPPMRQNNYATLLGQYEQAHFREEIQASMITVFETAIVPQTPSSPRLVLNIALRMLVGLLGGLGLAFIFENLDTTLYTTQDIEAATKLTVLAKIPKITKKQISVLQDGFSPAAEAFRNLATSIQQINCEQPKKVLLFMSAEPVYGNQPKSRRRLIRASEMLQLPTIREMRWS